MKTYLKDFRKINHYKQKQLAEYLKITQAEYSRIENGKRSPTIETLLKLKKLYNCKLDDLVSE